MGPEISETESSRQIIFQLKPAPPFRLDLTVWALRRNPLNLVDCWDGRTYRRVLLVDAQPVEVAVTQTGPAEEPLLRIEATNSHPLWEWASKLTALLVKTLGLHADLKPFYRLARDDEHLGPLVARFLGLKPPRFPSVFEAVVNAIASQQVSLSLGIQLLNRLAAAYAPAVSVAGELRSAFPRPEDLAGLEAGALRELGFSRNKETAILELARGLSQDPLDLKTLEDLNDTAARSRLLALRGVGPWSGEYVLLRGLGRWAVFPGDDPGAPRSPKSPPPAVEPPVCQEVRRQMARWHPYGGIVYFHLLLDRLAAAGHLA